jgi:hypothetical protein
MNSVESWQEEICDVQRNSMHCWGRLMIGFAGAVELKPLPVFLG